MKLVDKYTMEQLKNIMIDITGDEKLKIHDGRKYCDSDVWIETKTRACGYYDDDDIVEILCNLFYMFENPRDFRLCILDNGMVGLFRSDHVYSNTFFFESQESDKIKQMHNNENQNAKHGKYYVINHSSSHSKKKNGKASIRKI